MAENVSVNQSAKITLVRCQQYSIGYLVLPSVNITLYFMFFLLEFSVFLSYNPLKIVSGKGVMFVGIHKLMCMMIVVNEFIDCGGITRG